MKRICLIFLSLTVFLSMTSALCGCDGVKDPTADHSATTIICTNFAAYDFARSILSRYTENGGEGMVQLTVLGKPGQDMHSFEPSPKDIMSLSGADVVICTGAETWLDAALSASGNQTALCVSMMEACDVYSTGHDHDHSHSDASCAIMNGDEHVWLSVDYATRIVMAISDALRSADGDNAEAWEKSAGEYNAELLALKSEFHEAVRSSNKSTVVIADRHPFVYLMAELKLDCVAAFPGCSSETSATFETQTKLIRAVESNGLSYVFVIEGSDGKVAEVIAAETGAEVLTLNSLQVVTDYENTTYIAAMRQNLENIKKALQ